MNNMVLTFKNGIPQNLQADCNSRISISSRHYKYDEYSLKWEFNKDSRLILTNPIGFKPFDSCSTDQARDTFSIWIYNEHPVDDKLIFEFGRGDIIDCWFTFGLNFKGWRTAWVAFERDMEGFPRDDMDTLIIKAPRSGHSGVIYLDQIILSSPVDPRHHTRDFQVSFVNLEADEKANSHWLSLFKFYHMKPDIPASCSITDSDCRALDLISERYEEFVLTRQNISEEDMVVVRNKFKTYNINHREKIITGNSINLIHYYDIFPACIRKSVKEFSNSIDVKDYTELMFDIAVKFRSTDNVLYRNELGRMFIDLVEHFHDQGWAAGSSLGTMHHLGYNLTKYYPAVYLMREKLGEVGVLERTQKTMYWFAGTGRIYNINELTGGNIDIFNTTLGGMLASILIIEDYSEKASLMKSLNIWLSKALCPAPGLMACYKVDGAAFHHCNHYPAYAVGGFEGVTPVVYFLSGTPYRIQKNAHESLRKAVMSMRLYSNKHQWLLSLSARHPTGKWALSILPFKYMALSGMPDGMEQVDREVAAAYLRLVDNIDEDNVAKEFRDMGITAENDPNGHWTINYAALSLHRRDNWLVGARGHSRYLWANETYLDANLYGRYITHGHVQILSQGNPVNNADSGFMHGGWDWNRWPGTTTIHLPFELLRSDVRNVDTCSGFEEMLLSDESYAGGLNIEGKNGMFAMKLHEHPKYNGTHCANKSVFFFDNTLILLGSDIENNNFEYPTETTLFQNYLKDRDEPIWINDPGKEDSFPYEKHLSFDHNIWLLDNKHNGYYIPAGNKVGITRKNQYSRSQNRGDETNGDFAAAWIEHGKAPKNGEYEYAILVNTDTDGMIKFAEQMKQPETELYSVLQKNKHAHIVKDNKSNTIGYAVFEASNCLDRGLVKAVDTPCMIMTKETDDGLILSVVDPDLRLYEGIETDQYDKNGNRIEVSVYSRQWMKNESMSSKLVLTIKGKWALKTENKKCRILPGDKGVTVLEFQSMHGMPVEVFLNKI